MTEYYYTEKPTSEEKRKEISINILGQKLSIITVSGVFSAGEIDKGTKILINNSIIQDNWTILDLGCGYGIVSVALKKSNPSITVTATDINERAVKYAKLNAKKNNVELEVLQGNLYDSVKDRKFNTIILNPPQSAGKEICFAMITQAKEHLDVKGLLQIVARHSKGGATLEKKMKETFGNVKVTARESGFRIYVGILE